jgi:hypothetical protein
MLGLNRTWTHSIIIAWEFPNNFKLPAVSDILIDLLLSLNTRYSQWSRRPGFDSRHYQKKSSGSGTGSSASWVQMSSYLIEK